MKYKVCKTFNAVSLSGLVSLRKGTVCEEINGIIYHGDDKICFKTSQNAHDFFSRDDDGNAYERFDLVNDIFDIIKSYVEEDNASIINVDSGEEVEPEPVELKTPTVYSTIREHYPAFLKEGSEIFTFEFYDADVTDLENVKSLISIQL